MLAGQNCHVLKFQALIQIPKPLHLNPKRSNTRNKDCSNQNKISKVKSRDQNKAQAQQELLDQFKVDISSKKNKKKGKPMRERCRLIRTIGYSENWNVLSKNKEKYQVSNQIKILQQNQQNKQENPQKNEISNRSKRQLGSVEQNGHNHSPQDKNRIKQFIQMITNRGDIEKNNRKLQQAKINVDQGKKLNELHHYVKTEPCQVIKLNGDVSDCPALSDSQLRWTSTNPSCLFSKLVLSQPIPPVDPQVYTLSSPKMILPIKQIEKLKNLQSCFAVIDSLPINTSRFCSKTQVLSSDRLLRKSKPIQTICSSRQNQKPFQRSPIKNLTNFDIKNPECLQFQKSQQTNLDVMKNNYNLSLSPNIILENELLRNENQKLKTISCQRKNQIGVLVKQILQLKCQIANLIEDSGNGTVLQQIKCIENSICRDYANDNHASIIKHQDSLNLNNFSTFNCKKNKKDNHDIDFEIEMEMNEKQQKIMIENNQLNEYSQIQQTQENRYKSNERENKTEGYKQKSKQTRNAIAKDIYQKLKQVIFIHDSLLEDEILFD